MRAHQATAVAIGERAVLIEGPSGSGKSGLALELIDRGARLIGDDSLMLLAGRDMLLVRPHPNTRGLIEVRNLGLLPFPVCEQARAGLVIALDPAAPRFIEEAETTDLLGVSLPRIALHPDGPNLAIKAELALRTFGTPAQ